MRKLLTCTLILLVAGMAYATKEKEAPEFVNQSRGLLDCTAAVELFCGDTDIPGDNTGLPNNVVNYGCTTLNENGGEAVFFFTLATQQQVLITMVPSGCDLDLFLLSTCDEAECLDYSGGVSTETIDGCLDAGTYYVVVDGYGSTYPGAECPFTISLACTDCPEQPIDLNGTETCDGAPNLCDYLQGNLINIAWDLTGFVSDYDAGSGAGASCTGYGTAGPDMVYMVCLEAGGTINACIDDITSYMDLALWLVTDCADAANTCVVGDDGGNPECISYTSVDGGVYYLIVDMYSASGTPYPGLLYGDITGCCATATENTNWGNVKQLFR